MFSTLDVINVDENHNEVKTLFQIRSEKYGNLGTKICKDVSPFSLHLRT